MKWLQILIAVIVWCPSAKPQVQVLGIEATQGIQADDNSVLLVLKKNLLVRVYLSSVGSDIRASGVLTIVSGSTSINLTSSQGLITHGGSLGSNRLLLDHSVNFLIPPASQAATIELKTLNVTDSNGLKITCSGCNLNRHLILMQVPPMRLRIVGFSFKVPGSNVFAVPRQVDFDTVESWIRRAYPLGVLIASRTALDASEQGLSTDDLSCNSVNLVLSAIRGNEVRSGVDQRTHYYGLVPDDLKFVAGCSSGIPQEPNPSFVASGPSGIPRKVSKTFDASWDLEASYAGWYAGHELAHTLGRYHPGFCPGQTEDDLAFPAETKGHLSDAGGKYAGLDLESDGHATVLNGEKWSDIMTYCSYVWPSGYTYQALLSRIQSEGASAAGPGEPSQDDKRKSISILASVNLSRGTASIKQVKRVNSISTEKSNVEPFALVRAITAKETVLYERNLPLRPDSDIAPGQDRTALLDVIVPDAPDLQTLQIILQGKVADRVSIPLQGQGSKLSSLQAQPLGGNSKEAYAAFLQGMSDEETNDGLLIRWQDDSRSASYTVQIGEENGPLDTLAIAVKKHYYVVRKSALARYRGQNVRIVVSTNGLSRTQILSKTVTLR